MPRTFTNAVYPVPTRRPGNDNCELIVCNGEGSATGTASSTMESSPNEKAAASVLRPGPLCTVSSLCASSEIILMQSDIADVLPTSFVAKTSTQYVSPSLRGSPVKVYEVPAVCSMNEPNELKSTSLPESPTISNVLSVTSATACLP